MTTIRGAKKVVWGESAPADAVAADSGGKAHQTTQASGSHSETGLAVVYGDPANGRTTTSGKARDQTQLSAAHKSLPLGTKVRVTNPRNGRRVELTIVDRGPVPEDRMLDLSPAAAAKLGIPRSTRTEVSLHVVELPPPARNRRPSQ